MEPVEDMQHSDLQCSIDEWRELTWRDEWYEDIDFVPAQHDAVLKFHPSLAIFPDPVQGDLSNTLHPLLARENWLLRGFVAHPDRLWKNMQPALRMVTMFLTVPQVMLPWLKIAFAEECEWDRSPGKKILRSDGASPTIGQLQCLIQLLAHIPRREGIKFTFAAFRQSCDTEAEVSEHRLALKEEGSERRKFSSIPTQSPSSQIHGLHVAPSEPFNSELFVQGNPTIFKRITQSHKIFFHAAYAEFLQQDVQTVDSLQVLRTSWVFGMTIVHELAHVLYWHTHRPSTLTYCEPLYSEDQSNPELGSALERALFGCAMQAVIHPIRGVDIECRNEPCEWLGGDSPVCIRSRVAYFIEPAWIHRFFTTAWWDGVAKLPINKCEDCTRLPLFRYWIKSKGVGRRMLKETCWLATRDEKDVVAALGAIDAAERATLRRLAGKARKRSARGSKVK